MKRALVTVAIVLFSAVHLLSVPPAKAEEINIASVNAVSAVVQLDQALVLFDPVGDQSQYRQFGRPDIVVLTRAHPDHLSIDTMIGLLRRDTVVLAPQEVIEQLPLMISNNVITPFNEGSRQDVNGIVFSALSLTYNTPSNIEVIIRQRGNIHVVLEVGGRRMLF